MTSLSTFIAAAAPSGLFIAGMAIIGIALVMRSTRRRTIKSRAHADLPARERYVELTQGNRAARTLENVMAEMDELSRQIHGRLDTKIARLEMIIRDADERIAHLSRLQEGPPGRAHSLDVTLDSEAPLEYALPELSVDSASDAVGQRRLDGARTTIHALADRGLTAEEIAAEVSRPAGEVELILSLRQTSGSSSP